MEATVIDKDEEQEKLTREELMAIREGKEDARRGRVITLEEYEKARGL
jgi:predicted transcriptional regulator